MGKLPALPAPLTQILHGISGAATLLVLFRLGFTPGDGGGLVDIGRSVGVFIALIAAGAMVHGAMQTTTEPVPAPAT